MLRAKGMLDYTAVETLFGSSSADFYFTGNVKTRFHSQIRKNKQTFFKAKGERRGGTFSGHPTCTTWGNTYRNLAYHLFALWYFREECPFFEELEAIPLEPFWDGH